MSVVIGSRAKLKRPSTVKLMVKTREGKTYDLGIQKSTGIFKRYYQWRQTRKIKRYYQSRLKEISNTKERQEFTDQIEKLKVQLKGEMNG